MASPRTEIPTFVLIAPAFLLLSLETKRLPRPRVFALLLCACVWLVSLREWRLVHPSLPTSHVKTLGSLALWALSLHGFTADWKKRAGVSLQGEGSDDRRITRAAAPPCNNKSIPIKNPLNRSKLSCHGGTPFWNFSPRKELEVFLIRLSYSVPGMAVKKTGINQAARMGEIECALIHPARRARYQWCFKLSVRNRITAHCNAVMWCQIAKPRCQCLAPPSR